MRPPSDNEEPVSGPDSFLGQGWGFPPTFVAAGATVDMASALREVEESLRILLGTQLGERLMRPDYGCDLRQIVFESVDESLRAYITDLVRTAILFNEPRVQLESLDLRGAGTDGVLALRIVYSVRSTNSRHNFVFPFYLAEGTNLHP